MADRSFLALSIASEAKIWLVMGNFSSVKRSGYSTREETCAIIDICMKTQQHGGRMREACSCLSEECNGTLS